MTLSELEIIWNRIKSNPPPSDLGLLREVSEMEWTITSDDQIDIYCEMLLRISADVIICASEEKGYIRDEYENIFRNISNKIEFSGILEKSSELEEYFNKYVHYMLDF